MKARLVIIIAGLFFFSCEKYDHRTESIDQLQKDVAGLIRLRIIAVFEVRETLALAIDMLKHKSLSCKTLLYFPKNRYTKRHLYTNYIWSTVTKPLIFFEYGFG